MLHQVYSEKQRLDSLFKKGELITDEEFKSHWAKYLCVLSSGYIENSCRLIISDFARKNSSPVIQDFIFRKIESITNLKHNNICELLNSFSDSWRSKYEENVTDEQVDAINSVVANRHQIAHGRNVGISYGVISKYYKEITKAVEVLYKVVNKDI